MKWRLPIDVVMLPPILGVVTSDNPTVLSKLSTAITTDQKPPGHYPLIGTT